MSWSWVDTEHSIHWVQHPPRIVCLPLILMITSWPLNVTSASCIPPYLIDRHQTSSPWKLKAKFTLSQSNGSELTIWWRESQYLVRHPSTASKYSSKLTSCYGGVWIPIINTIFIESKYSRLSKLFLSLSYPKTQPLALLQELPFC